MKCVGSWLEVNGCFSFFSLFFGLLCRAGFPIVRHTLVKQEPKWKRLSTTCDERTKTRKKTTFLLKQSASWWRVWSFREFEQIEKGQHDLENAYTQTSLIHGFCLILFYFVKKLNICFYLNFSSYLSASQPQTDTRGSNELHEKVVVTSNICTCSSEGHEVCICKTAERLFQTTFNWCVFQWLVSFLWCWLVYFRPIVCQWTHLSPVSFAASNHWQGGSSAKQTPAQSKRQIFFFCFVLF